MKTRSLRSALALAALLACGVLHAADDDFTEIPDFPDTPSPSPSASKPAPTPVVTTPPPRATARVEPPAGVRALVEQYEAKRLKAITDRVLTVTVCGRNMWGGDSRRSHAFVAHGDATLEAADALWKRAIETGERRPIERALRELDSAHEEYKAARYPPPLKYSWRDSPPPKPIREARPGEEHPGTPGMGERDDPVPEPVIWNRYDQIPLE